MNSKNYEYLINGRLQDICALIQVLGLDEEFARRSEEQLVKDLQGNPISAQHWVELAKRHPEFFRVNLDSKWPVSLIARDVEGSKVDNYKRPPLSTEFVLKLFETAFAIHDIQLKREERWKIYIPLWGAFITGILGIVAQFLKHTPVP